jgi:ribonuclease J
LVTVREGERTQHGSFECEYVAVNHSIPDAVAIAIRTPAGLVLHTGDLKLDQLPLDDRPTDLRGLARLGDEGVDLMLVDSTNADVPGFIGGEREVTDTLDTLISRAQQRVIVACFASNVHRVQQVINVAVRNNRKVVFVGRSMVRNMGIALDLGILSAPAGCLVDLDEALKLSEREIVMVSTGSQGEPLSALSRMARREHRQVHVVPGDMVILTSSLVPGNEMAIYRVMNGLAELGADVLHQGVANVHVSGHAHAGELTLLYNLIKPSNVMPVHGEWRHLRANASLAIATGVVPDRVLIAPDGVVVDMIDGKIMQAGSVPVGQVYVDGLSVGDVNESTLSDRLVLGEGGFIAITVAVDANGRAVAAPTVAGRGFSDDPKSLDGVIPLVEMELSRTEGEGLTDPHRIAQAVRRVVGRWVASTYRRRPMIVPTVITI